MTTSLFGNLFKYGSVMKVCTFFQFKVFERVFSVNMSFKVKGLDLRVERHTQEVCRVPRSQHADYQQWRVMISFCILEIATSSGHAVSR